MTVSQDHAIGSTWRSGVLISGPITNTSSKSGAERAVKSI